MHFQFGSLLTIGPDCLGVLQPHPKTRKIATSKQTDTIIEPAEATVT